MQQCFPHYGVDTMARVGLRCVPGPHGQTAMHHNSGHCARQCACELVLFFLALLSAVDGAIGSQHVLRGLRIWTRDVFLDQLCV